MNISDRVFLKAYNGIKFQVLIRVQVPLLTVCAFVTDTIRYLRYSLTVGSRGQSRLQAQILLLAHALEKGLSFPDYKLGFGKDKAKQLQKLLALYKPRYGSDWATAVAAGVIEQYLSEKILSATDPLYELLSREALDHTEDDTRKFFLLNGAGGGTKYWNKHSMPQIDTMIYQEFIRSRSSVRNYSDQPIPSEYLFKAVEIAADTPSMCNRQTTRVHVVREKAVMKSVLAHQLGDQGWCMGADTIFILTADLSFVGGYYERSQVLVDGGMYAMNLVLALHNLGVATCCKMAIRKPFGDAKLRAVCNIPECEELVMLVLAGMPKDIPVKVPKSCRIPQDHILKLV